MSTEAKDIAIVRVKEAIDVAEAFAVQTRTRENRLAECPCPAHYREVLEARRQLTAAKFHLRDAKRKYRTCR